MERYNIYHRKDGRWEGRIYKGKSKTGKRKYKYIFGKSKEQVQKKIREFRNKEIINIKCSKTFSTIFSEWHTSIKHSVKESTYANYSMKANKHILPEFGDKNISDISANDVYSFIEIKQKAGLSNRYISDIIILLKTLFKYAVRVYHVFNPIDGITMPKKKVSDVRILDENEQKKLQEYISENHNDTTLGIALAMSTGLRIGEICGLQWNDIDFEKRTLTVKKTVQRIQCKNGSKKTKVIITDPKSESSKRCIPIPENMVEFLKSFKGNSYDYVISGEENPTEPRTMQYRFAKLLKNVKLPSVHFHALRHIFATNCIKYGFDVKTLSELLGHSSVEITLNRYVHSSFEQKREYMERLNFNF